MNLPTFGQLLAAYMSRSGISDSELARSIGVRRQTIFRWKEGLVERPRSREDVLQCAKKLRLSDDERDHLLLAAGFAPEQLASTVLRTTAEPPVAPQDAPPPLIAASAHEPALVDDVRAQPEDTAAQAPTMAEAMAPLALRTLADQSSRVSEGAAPADLIMLGSTPLAPFANASMGAVEVTEADAVVDTATLAPSPPPLSSFVATRLPLLTPRRLRWWPLVGLVLVVGVFGLVWARSAAFWLVATPTPAPPATVVLHPPPQPTPTEAIVASAGETLLLIAQFTGYIPYETYNVAGRIREELEQQLATAGLISTTVRSWPTEITTAAQARMVLTTTNALMVIWGEYDSGRVRVNLETRDPQASKPRNFNLTPDDELLTTINDIVPKDIRDTALLALGTLARDADNYPLAVGLRLSHLGNYEAAAAVFEHALRLQPADPLTAAKLNFYLGYLTERKGTAADYARAIAYYSLAVALNEKLYTALYNRGTLHIKLAQRAPANETILLEKLNAAITDLTTVITLQPTYIDAYLNRGVAYYERDEPDDMAAALADLDHVIATKRDYALAYYSRGLVHIRAGEGTEWVTDFQRALTLQPDYTGAVSGLCWGYALAQQAEKALLYCEQAVQHDQTGASRDSRAIAYAQLGRYTDALADFRAYLEWLQSQSAVFDYERNRGPFVEQWIAQLEAGNNPFDPTLLAKLRHRDHY